MTERTGNNGDRARRFPTNIRRGEGGVATVSISVLLRPPPPPPPPTTSSASSSPPTLPTLRNSTSSPPIFAPSRSTLSSPPIPSMTLESRCYLLTESLAAEKDQNEKLKEQVEVVKFSGKAKEQKLNSTETFPVAASQIMKSISWPLALEDWTESCPYSPEDESKRCHLTSSRGCRCLILQNGFSVNRRKYTKR